MFEFATTEDQKKALDFLMAAEAISRPVVGPPGMNPARTAALQKAFMDTMKDPELIEAAGKAQMELNPVGGAGAAAIAKEINDAPADAINLAKKMIDID